MKLDRDIERAGFFPDLAIRAVRRLLGNEEVRASLVQVEAAFDRGSMFRHLTVLVLTQRCFIQVHVDEGDNHSAVVVSAARPIRAISGVSCLLYTSSHRLPLPIAEPESSRVASRRKSTT